MRLNALLRERADIDVVGMATDGQEAVARIREQRPGLVFLDVQMPKLDGFGVLRAVGQREAPATIFVTAYDRYALAAFEAHALDYLLKPFSDERFDAALTHALRALGAGDAERHRRFDAVADRGGVEHEYLERIVLKSSARVTLLNVEDIDWIGAAGIYVELHTGSTMHLYRASLGALLERLDPLRFVRIHRSVVVNTDRIKELRPRGHSDYIVVLRDGRHVPLSRAYRKEIESWLRQPL